LGEPLGGTEGLIETVGFKKTTECIEMKKATAQVISEKQQTGKLAVIVNPNAATIPITSAALLRRSE